MKSILPTIFVILIGNSLIIGCNASSSARVIESKRRGDQIVAAIEKYTQRFGHLPNKLEQLTPEFLPRIENPTMGTGKWDYVVLKGGKHFELSFEGNFSSSPVYFWNSRDQEWYVAD